MRWSGPLSSRNRISLQKHGLDSLSDAKIDFGAKLSLFLLLLMNAGEFGGGKSQREMKTVIKIESGHKM